MFIEVTEDQLPKEIMNSELTLVYFGGENCTSCKSYSPILEELSDNYSDGVLYYKVNVDKSPNLATEYKIRGLPSVIVFKNGAKAEKLIGLRSYENIEEKLKSFM